MPLPLHEMRTLLRLATTPAHVLAEEGEGDHEGEKMVFGTWRPVDPNATPEALHAHADHHKAHRDKHFAASTAAMKAASVAKSKGDHETAAKHLQVGFEHQKQGEAHQDVQLALRAAAFGHGKASDIVVPKDDAEASKHYHNRAVKTLYARAKKAGSPITADVAKIGWSEHKSPAANHQMTDKWQHTPGWGEAQPALHGHGGDTRGPDDVPIHSVTKKSPLGPSMTLTAYGGKDPAKPKKVSAGIKLHLPKHPGGGWPPKK